MIVILFPWLLLGSLWAEFQVPPLTGPVVDQAGILSGPTRAGMERLLRELYESGGTQLQVLTVPDLGGLSIEEASIKVVDRWRLGSTKGDNGVLLMVARQERRVRIEVGQGREGVLPDVVASRIIREVIVPRFREGDADRALTAGLFAILHYTDPEFLNRRREGGAPEGGGHESWVTWLVILMFVMFFLPGLFFRRGRMGLWGVGVPPGGRWGGFGGGWGGGSGGGWSGGGGGFSGGGASGGW